MLSRGDCDLDSTPGQRAAGEYKVFMQPPLPPQGGGICFFPRQQVGGWGSSKK